MNYFEENIEVEYSKVPNIMIYNECTIVKIIDNPIIPKNFWLTLWGTKVEEYPWNIPKGTSIKDVRFLGWMVGQAKKDKMGQNRLVGWLKKDVRSFSQY